MIQLFAKNYILYNKYIGNLVSVIESHDIITKFSTQNNEWKVVYQLCMNVYID